MIERDEDLSEQARALEAQLEQLADDYQRAGKIGRLVVRAYGREWNASAAALAAQSRGERQRVELEAKAGVIADRYRELCRRDKALEPWDVDDSVQLTRLRAEIRSARVERAQLQELADKSAGVVRSQREGRIREIEARVLHLASVIERVEAGRS